MASTRRISVVQTKHEGIRHNVLLLFLYDNSCMWCIFSKIQLHKQNTLCFFANAIAVLFHELRNTQKNTHEIRLSNASMLKFFYFYSYQQELWLYGINTNFQMIRKCAIPYEYYASILMKLQLSRYVHWAGYQCTPHTAITSA